MGESTLLEKFHHLFKPFSVYAKIYNFSFDLFLLFVNFVFVGGWASKFLCPAVPTWKNICQIFQFWGNISVQGNISENRSVLGPYFDSRAIFQFWGETSIRGEQFSFGEISQGQYFYSSKISPLFETSKNTGFVEASRSYIHVIVDKLPR